MGPPTSKTNELEATKSKCETLATQQLTSSSHSFWVNNEALSALKDASRKQNAPTDQMDKLASILRNMKEPDRKVLVNASKTEDIAKGQKIFSEILEKNGITDPQYVRILYLQARVDLNNESGRQTVNEQNRAKNEGRIELATALGQMVQQIAEGNHALRQQQAAVLYPADPATQNRYAVNCTANDLRYMSKDLDEQGKIDFFRAAATWTGVALAAVTIAARDSGMSNLMIQEMTVTQQLVRDRVQSIMNGLDDRLKDENETKTEEAERKKYYYSKLEELVNKDKAQDTQKFLATQSDKFDEKAAELTALIMANTAELDTKFKGARVQRQANA